MKENIKIIGVYCLVLIAIWVAGTFFAKSVSDHEIVIPEQGVKCIVVSRMFNTSVDCWND